MINFIDVNNKYFTNKYKERLKEKIVIIDIV